MPRDGVSVRFSAHLRAGCTWQRFGAGVSSVKRVLPPRTQSPPAQRPAVDALPSDGRESGDAC